MFVDAGCIPALFVSMRRGRAALLLFTLKLLCDLNKMLVWKATGVSATEEGMNWPKETLDGCVDCRVEGMDGATSSRNLHQSHTTVSASDRWSAGLSLHPDTEPIHILTLHTAMVQQQHATASWKINYWWQEVSAHIQIHARRLHSLHRCFSMAFLSTKPGRGPTLQRAYI